MRTACTARNIYDNARRRAYIPASRREVDTPEAGVNAAQRVLFAKHR